MPDRTSRPKILSAGLSSSGIQATSLPSLHAIVLLHLLHVAVFESFCAKYSHTFDRLPFGIFSVKRLMASSVCACSEMLPALHCHKTVAIKTPMSVSDTGQSLHWEMGQFYMCPTALCLATVFNWLRHRNEAPKSALHFGPGRYR